MKSQFKKLVRIYKDYTSDSDMKRFLTSSLIVLTVIFSVGCKKTIDPEVTVSPRAQMSDYKGGTFTYKITCNTTWEVEDYESTIEATVTPTSGEGNDVVTVTLPENTTFTEQQYKFQVTAKGTDQKDFAYGVVSIKPTPFIYVDNSSIELPAEGGGRLVHVTAIGDWFANGFTVTKGGSNTSWCNVTVLESSKNKEINISADVNDTGVPRYAQFVLSLNDYPDVKCVIDIQQQPL